MDGFRSPARLNCCKNVTPVIGVRGLASAPERNLAWEVKLRWPLLPMVLTSGHPRERERIRELPPGVAFLPKPWQPFNVLVVAEEALAYARGRS